MTQRTKSLLELQKGLSGLVAPASEDRRVTGLAYDSRRVKAGDVFVALKGEHTDGHLFVAEAVEAGAVAVVIEDDVAQALDDTPVVRVRDTRRALAELSAAFWDWPSRRLRVVGVTGTNGKTTTTFLMASIARQAGMKAAALGTLGLFTDDGMRPTEHTTLEAPDLQRSLAELADQGTDLVAMEVSSHGLVQDRVWQVFFDVAILTNITQDHLDYHGTLEAYAQAKELLFTRYAELAAQGGKQQKAAINLDDPLAREIAGRLSIPALGFAMENPAAEVRAGSVEYKPDGTRFTLTVGGQSAEVNLPLVGRFNVENALAAAAGARALGLPIEPIAQGLQEVQQVPGRLERVEVGQDFAVLVDYCHTPDAVAKVLAEARRLTSGRVLCVIGCGGDRDPDKRPKMGAAATKLADWTVITSDNPRSEDPEAIIEAIVAGAIEGRYEVVVDRRDAIKRAVALARPGDVVLIGGKGHEQYQIVGDQVLPFDDRQVVREALTERLRKEKG